jgi:hypothetical protein
VYVSLLKSSSARILIRGRAEDGNTGWVGFGTVADAAGTHRWLRWVSHGTCSLMRPHAASSGGTVVLAQTAITDVTAMRSRRPAGRHGCQWGPCADHRPRRR